MYDQLLDALRAHSHPDVQLGTPNWVQRYLYSFTTGEGCGGPEHAGYWLHAQPLSRSACETTRERAEAAGRDARRWRSQPPRPRVDTWTGTLGELWDATDAARAADAAANSAARAAAQVAETDALRAAGFTPARLRHVDCYDGDNNEHLALEVIVNHGCRCGHGGAYYLDDFDDDVTPAGVWVTETSDGRHLIATTDTAPSDTDVTSALAAAAAARDAELEQAARRATERAAAVLSLDELAELSVDDYRAYLERIGRQHGVRIDLRPGTAPTPAAPDLARITAAAQRSFDTVLAQRDLHLEQPATVPAPPAGTLGEPIVHTRSVTTATRDSH